MLSKFQLIVNDEGVGSFHESLDAAQRRAIEHIGADPEAHLAIVVWDNPSKYPLTVYFFDHAAGDWVSDPPPLKWSALRYGS